MRPRQSHQRSIAQCRKSNRLSISRSQRQRNLGHSRCLSRSRCSSQRKAGCRRTLTLLRSTRNPLGSSVCRRKPTAHFTSTPSSTTRSRRSRTYKRRRTPSTRISQSKRLLLNSTCQRRRPMASAFCQRVTTSPTAVKIKNWRAPSIKYHQS